MSCLFLYIFFNTTITSSMTFDSPSVFTAMALPFPVDDSGEEEELSIAHKKGLSRVIVTKTNEIVDKR